MNIQLIRQFNFLNIPMPQLGLLIRASTVNILNKSPQIFCITIKRFSLGENTYISCENFFLSLSITLGRHLKLVAIGPQRSNTGGIQQVGRGLLRQGIVLPWFLRYMNFCTDCLQTPLANVGSVGARLRV